MWYIAVVAKLRLASLQGIAVERADVSAGHGAGGDAAGQCREGAGGTARPGTPERPGQSGLDMAVRLLLFTRERPQV